MILKNFIPNTRALIKLAMPILITQLIQNLVGFFDTVMAGRVSATDLAAVALASSIWMPIILTIYGLNMALATIIAQYHGSKKNDQIASVTIQTAWISLFISIVLILIFVIFIPIIKTHLELEPNLTTLLTDYLLYVVWGAPACCLFMVLRNFAEGLSITKPTMIISIIGLIINIPLNYIFIYGFGSIPALGGAGCGIATAIVYWLMFFMMVFYVYFAKQLHYIHLFQKFQLPNLVKIRSVLTIGIPIALSLLFEVGLFSVIALIIAPFGANVVASHQIALNFSGLVFMVPLSISMAVTIKVGVAIGEEKYQQAKEICHHSIIFALIIAALTAFITVTFSTYIAEIYSNNSDVIDMAISLMFLAALFQFSDAIQVISAGALRGYKDTKAILIITFIAYWVIGLSIGFSLGVTNFWLPQMGPAGFWIGIIIGLTTAAFLLFWRLSMIQKRYLLLRVC